MKESVGLMHREVVCNDGKESVGGPACLKRAGRCSSEVFTNVEQEQEVKPLRFKR